MLSSQQAGGSLSLGELCPNFPACFSCSVTRSSGPTSVVSCLDVCSSLQVSWLAAWKHTDPLLPQPLPVAPQGPETESLLAMPGEL